MFAATVFFAGSVFAEGSEATLVRLKAEIAGIEKSTAQARKDLQAATETLRKAAAAHAAKADQAAKAENQESQNKTAIEGEIKQLDLSLSELKKNLDAIRSQAAAASGTAKDVEEQKKAALAAERKFQELSQKRAALETRLAALKEEKAKLDRQYALLGEQAASAAELKTQLAGETAKREAAEKSMHLGDAHL